MGLFRKNPVDEEQERLFEELKKYMPGSPEYNAVLNEMNQLEAFAGKKKERKAFLDKSGRGNIIGKIIGFGGAAVFAVSAYKAEKDGSMLFGKLGEVITGFARILPKWL